MGFVDIIGSGLVRSVRLACLLCLFFLAVFLILLDLLVIFLILPVFVRTEEYVKRRVVTVNLRLFLQLAQSIGGSVMSLLIFLFLLSLLLADRSVIRI